jgi:hypothetical protein
MDNLFWFLGLVIITIILGGLNLFQVIFHYREKRELFARLSAKSLSEAEFYLKEYPKDVEEKAKRLEEERKNPAKEEEIERQKKAGQY